MNKTVTVNIGGMVFHIEELAYEKLKKYLEAIRGYFTTSDGRDEIVQDIEGRIAEMFTERIGTSRQVVTELDVEYIVDTLGRPEQVAGADTESNNRNSNNSNSGNTFNSTTNEKGYRRLYRDPDDKVVGGVCSGISHYFGFDPLWLRLIFAISFFVFGSGFLLYIILLVIVPKAKTTSEKLEMKGQPVNIDNIKKTIEEEVEDIKNRINGNGTSIKRGTSGIARFFETLGSALLAILTFSIKFFGGILAFILVVILIALFIVLMSMSGLIGGTSVPIYISSVFLNNTQITLAAIAIGLTIGVPVLALIFRIFRSLFNSKAEYKTLNYISGILFGIGIVLCVYLSVSISKEYRVRAENRSTLAFITPESDTLRLEKIPNNKNSQTWFDDVKIINQDLMTTTENNDSVLFNMVELNIVKADGDQFKLSKLVKGRGKDRRDAENNLRKIVYEYYQDGNTINFSDNFCLEKNAKYRGQSMKLLLEIPVGKSIYLGSEMGDVIYDIKNVTNTYDLDMIGHTWTMTTAGLECIGCNLTDESDNESDKSQNNSNVKISIDGKNIDINKDSNKDTIDWDNKDVNIHIDKNGVLIDAKEKK